MENNFHKNTTRTYFEIADANWGMYHYKTFATEEEAREVMDKKYTNRSENDGNDEFWRSRKQVILKKTETIEVLN